MIDVTIKKLEEYLIQMDKECADNKQEIVRKLELIKKYQYNKRPKDEKELKDISSLICWGNLTYCCAIKKPCMWRDSVLELLDIKPMDYKKAKESMWTPAFINSI